MLATLYRSRGVWYLSYYRDGQRIRESTGTPNYKIAKELLAQKQREVALATVAVSKKVETAIYDPAKREAVLAVLEARQEAVTIERALEEYATHSRIYKSEEYVYIDGVVLRKFFKAVPHVRYITDLRTQDVNEYLLRMSEAGAREKTRLNLRGSLHAFYEWARLKTKYLKENPIADVPRPVVPDWDVVFLKPAEIERVLQAVAGDIVEPLVATAIFAGLRRAELAWLEWTDIDLEKRIIRVRSKDVEGGIRRTKTRRNRSVPIFPELLRYLATMPLPHTGWVFRASEGGPWHTQLARLTEWVRQRMAKAKLPHAGLQVMRHTFVTTLLMQGVPAYKVAKWAGHSLMVLEKHYGGFILESEDVNVRFGNGAFAKRACRPRNRSASCQAP